MHKFINDFIQDYPIFRIKPTSSKGYILEGIYEKLLFNEQFGEVLVDYKLLIHVSEEYPEVLPTIFEISNKIEKTPDNHINNDGSLCLGAPHRLKMVMKRSKRLTYFFEECILPYLYAVTLKIEKGKSFVFGGLAHGRLGLIEDFQSLFHLSGLNKVQEMLFILSTNKKEANRLSCPCGCKKRLSKCKYFEKVQEMRKLFSRNEWAEHYASIKRGY